MKALPPDTVRLLSSSQVVTSVVNVVKELIENSLDAGSSSLEVKLDNYGLDRIEVRDNGYGIKAEDAPVMAVKHYTSKISHHEDLEHLETYGFRGEALGSICAISEVTITTKTAENDISTQYTLDFNGCVVSQKPSHLGQGTTVCALKLFRNLPVRRQYYSDTKRCKEELRKVHHLLMTYAILKPELRVVFTHNKVTVWQKSRVSDHGAALMAVLGASTAANLLPVQHRQEQAEVSDTVKTQIAIDGYFPKPDSDRNTTSSSTSEKSFIFVNNRPVNHKDILKLVKQYYTNAIQCNNETAIRRFPILMMNITVPASSVDVNLMPDKTQVMLHNKDAVLLAVESILISLYGSYSIGNDNHKAGPSCSEIMCKSIPATEIRKAPSDVTKESVPPLILENCTSNHKEKYSNTSLSSTANTSSLSSSEDLIIDKSLSDSGLFSLFGENIVLNFKSDTDCSSQKTSKHIGQEGEIPAESWSMGKAFTDPTSGQYLEPVKLHLIEQDKKLSIEAKRKNISPSKRPTNIIIEKTAKLTAYDLFSSCSVRQPLSACALFEQDTKSSILLENPRASLQDVTMAVKKKWESLGEEEKRKYEEKAQTSLESYNKQRKQVSTSNTLERTDWQHQKVDSFLNKSQGIKRKAPMSSKPVLDKFFSPQPKNKRNPPRVTSPLQFNITALRQALQHKLHSHLSMQGFRLINCLAYQCTWVVLCGRKLMLLNPFRIEEAVLFKRLLESNILPAASLQPPIQLTEGVLGGSEYMEVLMNMEKGSPSLHGKVLFTDARLVTNGFQIVLTPGSSSMGMRIEVTGMADCMPFYGIADLREILTAVKDRNAETVQQCRPLKVTSYLEGEAVRMARQMPPNMSREKVTNLLSQMKQLLENQEVCLHGRPFFHYLVDVPETEQEAFMTE